MSIFGMCVVDAYLLSVGCQGASSPYSTGADFWVALAEGLIDNEYEKRALRKRNERAGIATDSKKRADPALDASNHLISPTPTKRRKKNNPNHREQGRCMSCTKSTTYVCRLCQSFQPDPKKKQYWICDKEGKQCMGMHIRAEHPDKLARTFDSV